MGDAKHKNQDSLSSYEFQAEAMSVQDALIVLAIRLMGIAVREDPSAKQHILALARTTPLFGMESYGATDVRINHFVNWAGTAVMDELFDQSIEKLKGDYCRDALAWTAVNAVTQELTDELSGILHHIGKALGFSASEVEEALDRAKDRTAAGAPTQNTPT